MTASIFPYQLVGNATPTGDLPAIQAGGRHRNPHQPHRLVITGRALQAWAARHAQIVGMAMVLPMLMFSGLVVALIGAR